MRNKRWKHQMLRLDLLQSQKVNQFPNKFILKYLDREEWPRGFMFKNFRSKVVIEKDLETNILWFEKSFFEEIKLLYEISSLPNDDESVKNDLTTNFFQINESIGNQEFNPSHFGNGMQIKIADEYARFFWDSLRE
jgi:hypothetical protein